MFTYHEKMTFLSNGDSLNIDFQGTEGLSRNLVSTLLPNFNWSLSQSYLPVIIFFSYIVFPEYE
jgi:hypothetical protein